MYAYSNSLSRHISESLNFQTTGLTFQTGQDTVVRAQFINNGRLANTQDSQFRAVSDRWPVFAYSHDLGTVSKATAPVVVSVGHVRDPAIEYIVAGGAIQQRSLYFWSQFASVPAAVSSFMVHTSLPEQQTHYMLHRSLHSLRILQMLCRVQMPSTPK